MQTLREKVNVLCCVQACVSECVCLWERERLFLWGIYISAVAERPGGGGMKKKERVSERDREMQTVSLG